MFSKCKCKIGQNCNCEKQRHPSYEWWLTQQGKTVRITRGAFRGYMGRLDGLNYECGNVAFRTGTAARAYVRTVWIVYNDLEVVDDSCC